MIKQLLFTEGNFEISPQEGELRIAKGVTLDREEMDSYNLTLFATDAGIPPRNSTVKVFKSQMPCQKTKTMEKKFADCRPLEI